jgi:hypothetical protein
MKKNKVLLASMKVLKESANFFPVNTLQKVCYDVLIASYEKNCAERLSRTCTNSICFDCFLKNIHCETQSLQGFIENNSLRIFANGSIQLHLFAH